MNIKHLSILAVLLSSNLFSQYGIVYVRISVPATAEIMVTNPWNKKTGRDPRGHGTYFSEIPESGYSTEAYDIDMLGQNIFEYKLISPQDDGLYKIIIVGTKLGSVDLNISGRPDETAQKMSFKIKTFLDRGEEQEYRLSYIGDPATPLKLQKTSKGLHNNSLLNDLSNAGKLNLISDRGFLQQCISKANQLSSALHTGDINASKIYYSTIDNWINTAYHSPSTSRSIDAYAYSVLKEDLELLYLRIYAPAHQNTGK